MATIIPIAPHLADAGAEDIQQELSDIEKTEKILEEEYAHIANEVGAFVSRPFRFIWDPTISTACTDCIAEIRMTPWFFLNGHREIGYGSVYHECGHIVFSNHLADIMKMAVEQGGETRGHIMNLLLDRKDDIKGADYAPGFADRLRKRLAFIRSMTERPEYRARFRAYEERMAAKAATKGKNATVSLSEEERLTRFLKCLRPKNVYEDFFFAAKCHKSPRFKKTAKAMRFLRRKHLLAASKTQLLWIAEKVHEILGDAPEEKKGFKNLMLLLLSIDNGSAFPALDPKLLKLLAQIAKNHAALSRKSGMSQLITMLQRMRPSPGPMSVGLANSVPIKTVPRDPKHRIRYETYKQSIEKHTERLLRSLAQIDNTSEFTLYGQDEGELDFSEAGRIAAGLSGYHMETVVERDIDAAIHLAVDCSGSMSGKKVEDAKRIVTLFTEGILSKPTALDGHVWGFNSNVIYDFGPVSGDSGFVTLQGDVGNSDTHLLRVAGQAIMRSPKRRKILIVLCDDGPDDMRLVRQLAQQLMARGIIVVHVLFDVHGTPDIYPIELPFTSMEECLDEFGGILTTIIANVR